jgi:pyridinium-3,5-bisthiocarboxylic acid mononucleotide nickel chelatase
MNRILFLDSVAGVAGDMFAAAFLDAGVVTPDELRAIPAKLGLPEVEVQCTSVIRATMRAMHVRVIAHSHGHPTESKSENETGEEDANRPVLEASAAGVERTDGRPEHNVLRTTHHGHSDQHAFSSAEQHLHMPAKSKSPSKDERDTDDHGYGHGHAHGQRASGGTQRLAHSHGDEPKNEAEHEHTHYPDIDGLIERSQLEPGVRKLARSVFRLLAEAEAAAHGMAIEDVAFHEVGAIDSIVDIVMAAYCVHKAGASEIHATPIRLGRGFVTMAHGTHPVPPPASARLLEGMPVAAIPSAITRENIELSTPTGIAILKALAPRFGNDVPAGTLRCQGLGAGTMKLGSFPNVFRVMLLDATAAAGGDYETDRVMEIACNIDDDTAEHLAWLAERLMADGVLDVALYPATGKKGRPMTVISVLCTEADWRKHAEWLLLNSTTFGVRYQPWDRLKLARRFEQRSTANGPVQYKIGLKTSGEIVKEKAEFEDWKRVRE